MEIKVSIVVPVYNDEKYIDECVESILKQTLQDFEVILVDDGSNDHSKDILDTFAAKDKRVRVIHKQNEGVSSARNDGLAYCKGDYIYIMDSDDYLEPNALEVLYNNALKTGADVVISDHYTFKDDNVQMKHHFFSKEFETEDDFIIQQIQNMTLYKEYSPYPTNENKGLGIAAPWTKLLKRELIFDNHLVFDSYLKGIFDDGLFTLSVFQYAKKIVYVRENIYHYRILQTSLIHRYNKERISIDRRVFQRIEEFSNIFHKDKEFKHAYYARIILFMVNSFDIYFFNKQNKNSAKMNFREFNDMINSEPYKIAIKEVDITKLSNRQKRITFLLRLRLTFGIWLAYRIKMKYKA